MTKTYQIIAWLLALLSFIVLFAASASAAPPVPFCSFGTGAGQCVNANGAAVDQSTGDVYVADGGNSRVDEFDSTGRFLFAFGFGVANGADELQTCSSTCQSGLVEGVQGGNHGIGSGETRPASVAVDNDPLSASFHDLYVSDRGSFRVQKFGPGGEFMLMFGKGVNQTTKEDVCTASSGDTCGAGSADSGEGGLASGFPLAAVDSEGDVWVADVNRVEKFSPDGEFLSEIKLPGARELRALAIDTDPASPSYKDFYVLAASTGRVLKLDPAGETLETLDEGGHPNALGVDPASGNIFISDQVEPQCGCAGPATLLEYDSSGVHTESFATGSVIGAPELNALAFGDNAQRLYVIEDSAGQAYVLPESGPLPEEGGEIAQEVSKSGATLTANVNPENASTTSHFQYIDDEHFNSGGFSNPATRETPEAASIGEDFSEHAATATITGLVSGVTYHFRVVTTNSNGTVEGIGATFLAEPPARIDSTYVTGVSSSAATLNTEIGPLGDETTGPSRRARLGNGISTGEERHSARIDR